MGLQHPPPSRQSDMFWLYSGVPQKNMKEVTISVQTCFTNNTKQICKPRSQSRRTQSLDTKVYIKALQET